MISINSKNIVLLCLCLFFTTSSHSLKFLQSKSFFWNLFYAFTTTSQGNNVVYRVLVDIQGEDIQGSGSVIREKILSVRCPEGQLRSDNVSEFLGGYPFVKLLNSAPLTSECTAIYTGSAHGLKARQYDHGITSASNSEPSRLYPQGHVSIFSLITHAYLHLFPHVFSRNYPHCESANQLPPLSSESRGLFCLNCQQQQAQVSGVIDESGEVTPYTTLMHLFSNEETALSQVTLSAGSISQGIFSGMSYIAANPANAPDTETDDTETDDTVYPTGLELVNHHVHPIPFMQTNSMVAIIDGQQEYNQIVALFLRSNTGRTLALVSAVFLHRFLQSNERSKL